MQKTTVERRSPESYRKRFTERVASASHRFDKSMKSISPGRGGELSSNQNREQHYHNEVITKDPGAGKTSMTHTEFLRMTNLHSRKAEVLRIATENYKMA